MKIDPRKWTHVNRLLDKALDLSEAERAAWIESLDPGDASLLVRLLKHESAVETADFLERLPSIDIALTPAPAAEQRVGPYRLLRLLGEGGMASVWLAERDDGLIDRSIALKLPRQAYGNVFVERAERERGFLARLTHPNIARLYDAGVTGDGQPYLALEYVEGMPIDTYCEQQQLGVADTVRLFRQIVDAVVYAHAQLIIHRDLKPANILVTGDGEVRLLDFGIAKLLEDDQAGRSDLTKVSGSALTTAYAAPEHLRGDPLTVSADIYSMGVVLYELLTGRRPFTSEDASNVELQQAILEESPQPPSDVNCDSVLRRKLKGDLDTIVLKTLAKNPARRYESAQAFGDDLRRYLANEPVLAQPDSAGYRLRKFVGRHRAGVAAGAAVTLLLVAATSITSLQTIEAARQRDAAVHEQQKATATTRFLGFVLDGVSGSGGGVPMPELLDRALLMLDRQDREQPHLASLYEEIAARFLGLGQTDRALELLDVAEELARRQDDRDVLANVLCLAGREQLRARGQADIATEHFDEAQSILSAIAAPSRSTRVQCTRAFAMQQRHQGDFDGAIARLQSLAYELSQEPISGSLALTTVLNDMALTYNLTGQLAEALNATEQAVLAMEATGRTDTVSWMVLQSNLANSMMVIGEVSSALEVREALRERAKALGGREYPLVTYGTAHAANLYNMGYFEDALEMLVTSRREQEAAGYELSVAVTEQMIGATLIELGRPVEANEYLDRAEAFFRSLNRPSNLESVAIARAEIALAQGDVASASRAINEVLREKGYMAGTPGEAGVRLLAVAARITLAAGDAAAAEGLANDSYHAALRIARDPATNASVGRALLFRGKARLMQGLQDAALVDLEQAANALSIGKHPEHPNALEASRLIREIQARN